MSTTPNIVIPDPDDQFGMPLYEGDGSDLPSRMVPGRYAGNVVDEDGDVTDDILVHVTGGSAYMRTATTAQGLA